MDMERAANAIAEVRKLANFVDGPGIPLGLGMALAQNGDALKRFAQLPPGERQAIIDRAHGVHSKEEMSLLVRELF